MGVKAVVVLVGVSGCFPTEPRAPEPIRQIDAPEELRAKPLVRGQWATYAEWAGGHAAGQAHFRVEETASCGTWVRVELRPQSRTWRLCIDGDQQVALAELDGQSVEPRAYAAEIEALRTRSVPPRLVGTFARADINVPAGHFLQTLRVDGTWLHPDVPLGAAVRVMTGDRIDVLLAYGEHEDTVEREPPRPPGHDNLFVTAGFGFTHSSGTATRESDSGTTWSVLEGLHVSRTVDIVAAIDRVSSGVLGTQLVGGGVRWSPWRTSKNASLMAEAYLQGIVGYVGLSDPPMAPGGAGLIASAGWLLETWRDWGSVLQLDYMAAYVGGPEKATGALSLTVGVQLEFR